LQKRRPEEEIGQIREEQSGEPEQKRTESRRPLDQLM
jgi:hypothetical protein